MSEPAIKNGYVLLPRIVLEGLGGRSPLAVALYVWLLCRASHKTRQGFKCTYQRGELFTSIDMMRDAMKYKSGYRWVRPTRDMIRSAIGALTGAALVTTAKTTRGLIVTIYQYEYYQNPANYGTYTGDTTEPHTEPEMTPHYIQRIKKNGRDTPRSFSYKSFDQMDRERAAAANEKAKERVSKKWREMISYSGLRQMWRPADRR
jgi:hypothetical protein